MSDPRARPKRRPRSTPADPARAAAFDVLAAVREQDAYTNLVLPPLLRSRGLTGRDAAFATELVSGTIRRQGTYDAVIAANVDRPLGEGRRRRARRAAARHPPAARDAGPVARRGRHQRRPGAGQGRAGPVRVRQRRAAQDLRPRPVRLGPPGRPRPGVRPRRVRLRRALPPALGGLRPDRGARATAPASSTTCWPPTTRPRRSPWWPGPGWPPSRSWSRPAAPRRRTRPTPWCSTAATPARSPPSARAAPGCRTRGRSWSPRPSPTQPSTAGTSAGSTSAPDRAARPRCSPPWPAPRGRGCWPPSGRSTGPGSWPPPPGAPAGACSAWSPPTARGRPGRDGTFDRVLVDAPCSGLGALRRRPESRWRRTPADLDQLVPLQQALLASALDAVRPGGVVAYATCSPVLAETAGVVSAGAGRPGRRTPGGRGAAVPRGDRPGRPAARHRAAVAAPARHRRDVPGPAAPFVTTSSPSTTSVLPRRRRGGHR